MNEKRKIRVLFCCMGNICRSPTAHGVFEGLVAREGLSDRIEVDSAGTHAYHVGNPPDLRAQETALRRGFDLSAQRARKAMARDFERFDYVLAMDRDNYRELAAICPPGLEGKLNLFMDFAPSHELREVPDPYYGGPQGFERVFDMVEEASLGLLERIRQGLPPG
jgi:protein-tyrosine phosphatase